MDGFAGKEGRSLRKVCVADLGIYATMRDCVFEGEIVSEPVVRTGVDLMVRDSRGATVRTQIYNCVPVTKTATGMPSAERLQLGLDMFAKGMQIRILDPYYKLSDGMMRTIRVDDPREVQTFWKPAPGNPVRLAPTKPTAAAREKGNAAIHAKLHDLALYE